MDLDGVTAVGTGGADGIGAGGARSVSQQKAYICPASVNRAPVLIGWSQRYSVVSPTLRTNQSGSTRPIKADSHVAQRRRSPKPPSGS
jgi:NAD(P)-dependent dehydrogenase (short-subunit alcohol dehydrogenase family)